MSYDGTLNFGLLGDYDALPDLDDLAAAAARRDRRARDRRRRRRARQRPRAAGHGARAPRRSTRAECGASSAGCCVGVDRASPRWPARCCCCSRATTRGSREAAGPGERVEARCPRQAAAIAARQARRSPTTSCATRWRWATSCCATAGTRPPARCEPAGPAHRPVRRRDRGRRPGGDPRAGAPTGRRGARLGRRAPARRRGRRPAAARVRRAWLARPEAMLAAAASATAAPRARPDQRPPSATSPATRRKIRERPRRRARPAPSSSCFPELALTGYPPEDLLLKEHFLRRRARGARARSRPTTRGIVALVGFPERDRGRLQRARGARRRRGRRRSTARCTCPTTASSTSSATSRPATAAPSIELRRRARSA